MNRDILERYFKDTCTPEERAQVELWLSEQTTREAAEEDITRLWDEFQDEVFDDSRGSAEIGDQAPLFESVWAGISGHAAHSAATGTASDSEKHTTQRVGTVGHPKHRWGQRKRGGDKWLYPAAACVGFAMTLGLLFWFNREPATPEGDGYITVMTSKGERKWVTLSDGSEVFLNADSRLTYPRSMDLQQAAIYMEGEAFFNMTESDIPRIIKAGGVEAWAGERSKFNISAFPSDSTVTVAVDEGKAEIRNGYGPLLKLRVPDRPSEKTEMDSVIPLIKLRPAVVMNQRELAIVHKNRGEMEISDTLDDRKAFGWKDGILYFDGADPNEVVRKLERWYGVTVDVCEGGMPRATTYSAQFDNEDIDHVLAQMSQILPIRYEIVGSTVLLCGK